MNKVIEGCLAEPSTCGVIMCLPMLNCGKGKPISANGVILEHCLTLLYTWPQVLKPELLVILDQLVPQETYGHQGTLEDAEDTQVSKLGHERT